MRSQLTSGFPAFRWSGADANEDHALTVGSQTKIFS